MTFSKLGTDLLTDQIIELPKASRPQGLYIIGIQGTGKSGLIENLIMQDIKQQIGVCVLDPHGELIEHVIARLEPKQEKDVILLDITQEDYPFGLNLFTCSNPKSIKAVQEVVDLTMHIFEKLYDVSRQTPRMAQFLRNCSHTLVANPGYTMADIPLLLQDEQCRRTLVAQVTDPQVRLFWKTYNTLRPSEQFDRAESTLNKMDELLQPLPRNIVGQTETTIDLQQIMQEGKILLVKLSAQIESVSSLIGSLIVALILNAAYNRPAQRRQFHLYADEFQRFATEDFATLLEEARKFGIGTTIAHQNRSQLGADNKQLETNLKDRSRSVGNLVVFRVNSRDAEDLAGEFDVTPEEAWEEELEEEQLEIREQERLEMMEVIDGEEEIDTPVKDVVGHLLRGGSHPDPVVNTFTYEVIQPFLARHEQYQKDGWANILNTWLYKSMTEGQEIAPPTNIMRDFCLIAKSAFYGGLLDDNREAQALFDDVWDNNTAASDALYQLVREAIYQSYIRSFHNTLKKLQDQCDHIMLMHEAHSLEEMTTQLQEYFRTGTQQLHLLPWVRFDISDIPSLAWEPLRKEVPRNIRDIGLRDTFATWQLLPHQEEQFYSPSDMETEVEQRATAEREKFEELVTMLKDVLAALADEPMYAGSGIRQPRKRQQILLHPEKTFPHPRVAIPHPQRTYADMVNEIANQLSSLPNYTARTRITVDGQTVEHTLKTFEPEKGLYGKPLQERIARIQARNIQEGMLRNRADVEAEITQRQTQPPPQQARHARNVPLQKTCKNCGLQNNSDAQFCNQCGTKL